MALQERFHRDSTGSSLPEALARFAQVDEPSGPATPREASPGLHLGTDLTMMALSMTVGTSRGPAQTRGQQWS